MLGYTPWEKQLDILNAYAEGEPRISVPSGHRGGKTASLSWIVIHRLLFEFPQRTVATSPTEKQLYDVLCSEIRLNISRLPEILKGGLKIQQTRIADANEARADENYFSARTARVERPEALSGIHSQGSVLIIVDEAAGVAESIYQNGVGSMAGERAQTILTGNPTRVSGMFWKSFTRLARLNPDDLRPGRWHVVRINCEESPFVTQDFRDDIAARYGRNSNEYRVRVLGLPPLLEDDIIIARELVEAAQKRDVPPLRTAPRTWGLRIAHGGTDRNALVVRHGNRLLSVERRGRGEAKELAVWLRDLWRDTPRHERPSHIYIDLTGQGTEVRDLLDGVTEGNVKGKEPLPVVGINMYEAPPLGVDRNRYANLLTQCWFRAREWFEERNCFVANDEELVDELSGTRYSMRSGVQSVDGDLTDSLGRRAYAAEAFMLTFADDLWPDRSGTDWNQPLTRA